MVVPMAAILGIVEGGQRATVVCGSEAKEPQVGWTTVNLWKSNNWPSFCCWIEGKTNLIPVDVVMCRE
jgi:hypothetical protein